MLYFIDICVIGQFAGGTYNKKGRNKGFRDPNHITGQAIGSSNCRIGFVCNNATNITEIEKKKIFDNLTISPCYTAPFVRCNESYPWVALRNLHVHSNRSIQFLSQPFNCPIV